MDKKKQIGLVGDAITGIALVVFAAYILIGINGDVLYTAHDRTVFSEGSTFFHDAMSRPSGLIQYVGAFLTQFMYYPVLGASILIVMWMASCLLSIKVFHLEGVWRGLAIVPVACLAASVVDLGYWVYVLNIPGYYFSQTVGYLCVLLLLWAAQSTPHRFRLVWYVVVGFCGFPLFGWMSYVFSISLAICMYGKADADAKNFKALSAAWVDVLGVILTLNAPLIFRPLLYIGLPLDDIYTAGFPIFRTTSDECLRPTIPFIIMAVTILFLSFGRLLPKFWTERRMAVMTVRLLMAVGCAYGVWTAMFKDENFIYEMQMSRATMNDDWQSVIKVAEKTNRPSRTMVMLKNIALLNTGELGERSFELGNSGVEIHNPDSLNLNLMHIASPLIYYNYGKVNYAMRWCMEFGVPYGFSPYYLKMLVRCAAVTGEKKLQKRYTNRLHRTIFYRDWQPKPATKVVKELHDVFPDALDSDDNSCERFIISTFSKAYYKESALITELALFYSIIQRDAALFCMTFYDYVKAHPDDFIPKAYGEAYCLFVDRFPDRFPYKVKITDETVGNYRQFMAAGNEYAKYAPTEEAIGESLFDVWGGTYWWFNAFGRNTY